MPITLARSASEGSGNAHALPNPKSPIPNPQAALGFALLLALVGCSHALNAQPKAESPSGGSLEVVIAGKPVRKTLPLFTTQPARIEAIEQTPIHSKLTGYVSHVAVDYGDRVKKDQPLLTLAVPELDAELVQKRALVEQSISELRQAETGVTAAQAMVATAHAKVSQAEAANQRGQADVDRWRSEAARIGQLAASGAVTSQLVDETHQKRHAAEAALAEARAAIEAAKAGVAQSEAEGAKARADVDAAKARTRVAEANVAQVEAMLSYLNVKAPFDGIVTRRHVDTGHFVLPATGSAAPLLVVARTDKVRVILAVPENDAGYVDIGDPVVVDVPALRQEGLRAQVTRTSFVVDASNRALETIVDLDNAAGRLRPGLYATVKITLEERKDALALPSAAVVRLAGEAFCFRLIDGKAAKTPLKLGIKAADDFEITGGLMGNDTVILNKASTLKDGQPVEVLKTDAKKA